MKKYKLKNDPKLYTQITQNSGGPVIAILTLAPALNGPQWWSRKFHLVIAILILMASATQIYTDERDRSIGYLLYADVIFGIATFGYVYLTCPKY